MDVADIRKILRVAHNFAFFTALYTCIVCGMYEKGGIGLPVYAWRLALAVLLLWAFFLFADFLPGRFRHFFSFTAAVVFGIVISFVLIHFVAGEFTAIKVPFCILVFVLSGMSYKEHNSSKPIFYPDLLPLSVYIILWGLGALLASGSIMRIALIFEIADIFIFIIFLELTNLESSMNQVRDRAYLPAATIRERNKTELLFFVIAAGLLILLSLLVPTSGKIVDLMSQATIVFLRWLIEVIVKILAMLPTGEDTTETMMEMAKGIQFQEGGMMNEKLWNVIYVIALIAIVILFIFCIAKLLLEFYKKFQRTQYSDSADVSEFIFPTDDKKGRSASERKPGFFDRTNESRIRRAYIKFIKSYPDSKYITKALTPTQIEELVRKGDRSGLERLHDLYEKARYKETDCSADEVREMRGLCHANTKTG